MQDRFCGLPDDVKAGHFKQLAKYKEELRQNPILKSLFLEVTLKCNEHCLHCGSNCGEKNDNTANRELSDDEITGALIKLKQDITANGEKLPFLSVTGGEPMLRKNLSTLMKKIHSLGYKWGMTTNGTLITPEIAKALKDAGMYSASVSIDGYKNTHDAFRRTEGAYERAYAGIDNLKNAGIKEVIVTTVVHKGNIHELDDIKKDVLAHDIKTWRIINVEPIGRARDNKEIMLDSKDLRYMIDYIIKERESDELNVIYSCNHFLGLNLERKTRPWYFFCRAGLMVASIQYNGDIGACLDIERRENLVYGNIKKDRLYDVWKCGFKEFRIHKENYSEKCKNCSQKEYCEGGGYHTWDFDNNEPLLCMPGELKVI